MGRRSDLIVGTSLVDLVRHALSNFLGFRLLSFSD